MFGLDAERAHETGIEAMRLGLASPLAAPPTESFGEIERFGLKFANPLGVAAGFDKNGVVVDRLASLGFGFVEVGTVTYKPQPGNPKPRLFRLQDDEALINRLGFNNDGAAVIAERLKKLDRRCIVGVNIGRNKDVLNEDTVANYVKCFETIFHVADYITINVSSPNTPQLRDLQLPENLSELLRKLQERNSVLSAVSDWLSPESESKGGVRRHVSRAYLGKPLLVKISPDVTDSQLEQIVYTCTTCGIDGIVATNTTIARDGLATKDVERLGTGGLSGKPLTKRSTDVISTVYRYSKDKLPIIGVGGIFTAEDAFEKIAAGASLLQAYTGFVYGGPSFAHDINTGLAAILKERGFRTIDEAVGSAN